MHTDLAQTPEGEVPLQVPDLAACEEILRRENGSLSFEVFRRELDTLAQQATELSALAMIDKLWERFDGLFFRFRFPSELKAAAMCRLILSPSPQAHVQTATEIVSLYLSWLFLLLFSLPLLLYHPLFSPSSSSYSLSLGTFAYEGTECAGWMCVCVFTVLVVHLFSSLHDHSCSPSLVVRCARPPEWVVEASSVQGRWRRFRRTFVSVHVSKRLELPFSLESGNSCLVLLELATKVRQF